MEKLSINLPGLSAQQYDPVAAGRMKVDAINQVPGELTGHDCPKCRNRGYYMVLREDGSFFSRECDCMKIRRCIWEMERSGLKNSIRELTFDKFQTEEEWQGKLKAGAVAYAEAPEGWLLFCGQSGSGKTHLCTAVCRHRLLAGDSVRYMSWRSAVAELKGLALDSDRRADLIEGYKTIQVLYVDDMFKSGRAADGTTNPTGADINLAFEILNHRYLNKLPTIISTEKTPQELVEIDEATGSRIIEMAGKNVFAIGRNQKRNYRLRDVTSV